jgi:hypothetical protein
MCLNLKITKKKKKTQARGLVAGMHTNINFGSHGLNYI